MARICFTANRTPSSSLRMRHKYPSSSLSELSRSLNAARPRPPSASPRIKIFSSPVVFSGRQIPGLGGEKAGLYLRTAAGLQEEPQDPAGDRGLAADARPCQRFRRTTLVPRRRIAYPMHSQSRGVAHCARRVHWLSFPQV